MKIKIVIAIIILFALPNSIFSSEYADLLILVNQNGDVLFSGIDSSNTLPLGKESPEFTSKKGKIWTLNITTPITYETFIFETRFPKGAQIQYIKTTPNFRIDEEGGYLKIIGTGENKHITLIVQYQIKEESSFFSISTRIGIIGIFIGFFCGFLLRYHTKRQHKSMEPNERYYDLNERQKEILHLLREHEILTQKKLEEHMQIPKASISRNVKTLYIKGYIEKKQLGNTNYISLLKK